MKTLDKIQMLFIPVDFIPQHLKEGEFYYSEKYKTATHICPCGCAQEFSVPIKNGEWQIISTEPLTVIPSFSHTIKCKAHYIITNGYANILRYGMGSELWDTQFEHNAHPGE